MASGTLASVVQVDTNLLVQDSSNGYAIASGSGNGWYTYSGPPTYLITPTPGKVLVFKTADGKYAKVEILSFFDNPITSEYGGFYTFNYVYQSEEGNTMF